jgi:Domain of unknown function (DUF4168)
LSQKHIPQKILTQHPHPNLLPQIPTMHHPSYNLSLTDSTPALCRQPKHTAPKYPRHWQAGLWSGLISVITLSTLNLCLAAPTIAQNNRFSEDQIRRYAAAARAIEGKRQEILGRAKSDPGWDSVASRADGLGKRVCDLPRKPPFLENLCNELYSFSQQTIQNQGFSTREFNNITNAQRGDVNLRRRIQQSL